MPYDPYVHHRQTTRLPTWDYAGGGAYFVTLCTHARTCLFGDIVDGRMRLSDVGSIVAEEWLRSADLRPWVTLDAFVVMPNHLHGIVLLAPPDRPSHSHPPARRGGGPVRPGRSLGSLLAGYKGAATARINAARGAPGQPVWQRNYYEHIIRNDDDLERIRAYIANNPARWDLDREHPGRPRLQRSPPS